MLRGLQFAPCSGEVRKLEQAIVKRSLWSPHLRALVQIFIAWQQHTQQGASFRAHLALLPPPLASALTEEPSQRTAAQLECIGRLFATLPIASAMPKEALAMFCRYCSIEVLHEDMVCFQGCICCAPLAHRPCIATGQYIQNR